MPILRDILQVASTALCHAANRVQPVRLVTPPGNRRSTRFFRTTRGQHVPVPVTLRGHHGAMRKIAIIAFVLLPARSVYAECRYQNGYYDPGLDGACIAETSAPEGCRVHFVIPYTQATATFTVHRGTRDITLPATFSLVESVGVPLSLVDPTDCDCTRMDATLLFDRHALTLTGAKAGDPVEFASGHLYVPQIVAITAAAPCPAVV